MNKEYLESQEKVTVRVEMEDLKSFYQDKKHQIWLWWAIEPDTGAVVGFWFGRREHPNMDKLLGLLEPLKLGVYTDGKYVYSQGTG
ncbi:MAG: hypothetical protein LBD93_12175 [Treponema sp.]|nr:hypothetical protein [Treponema sp.]